MVLLAVEGSSEDAVQGIAALVEGRQVSLGTLAFASEHATGISQTTTVGAELAIYVVIDGEFPSDEVDEVNLLTERPVLMVGDGVNDAPVLAAAEVGIAMGAKGTMVASESAAAVIPVDDSSRTVHAMDIGVDTGRIALQSIWLGIALSLVLMVIAAFGFIPATLGALLQEVVDLLTIANALRAIGITESRSFASASANRSSRS